jgi:alkanesulfonate monooxygenase SsuD/methylene tetrahydromethanopterin reductase-like flavin-dependent oxidoreductase (luciferase family)
MHSVGYVRDVVRPALAEGARRRQHRVDDLELYASVFAVSGRTRAEREAAEREVRQQIAFYASTPNYRLFLEYHGYGSLGQELSRLMRRGDIAAMAPRIPYALLEDVAMVASPEDLPVKLRQRYEGVLQRVSLYFPIPSDDDEADWQQFVHAFHAAA